MSDPISTPSPAEVASFLQSESTPGSVRLDLPPEVAQELVPDAPSREELPTQRVELPIDPTFSPDAKTVRNTLFWSTELADLGEVTVSDSEKVLYQKAMELDAPLRWKIALKTKTPFAVDIKSRSMFEQQVIFESLRQDSDSNKIKDPVDWMTRAQQLSLTVMVEAVNGRPFTDTAPTLPTTVQEAVPVLNALADAAVHNMSDVRWSALTTCLRLFEIKCKLCNDNVNNDTFWNPAG